MENNNHGIDFPYRDKIYNDSDRIDIFKKLKKESLKRYSNEKYAMYSNIKISNIDYLYNGKYNYLISEPQKKYHLYMLSDLFNDHCRVLCQFGKHISPYRYYETHRSAIKEKLEKKNLPPTPLNIREQIYLSTVECSIHNPLIIKYFIEKFSAKNILDFSMGWGDRLIGSLTTNINLYFGTDPNECLHPGYQRIIKLFKPLSPNPNLQTQIMNKGYQDIKLPENIEFDLLYTSPPYFDYEIYSEDIRQSVKFAQTEHEWLNKFLYPSILKSVNKIKNGGHVVLYLSQERGKIYMEKFLAWMKTIDDLYYMGNIFFSDVFLKGLHPIFIYEKNTLIPIKLYNPPIQTETLEHRDLKLNVIRDDLITGGTKCRAIISYLQNLFKSKPNITELIYLGASNGYAQVALAHGLQLLKSKIKLRLYAQSTPNLPETKKLQDLASYLYPDVTYVHLQKSFKEIWPIVDAHTESNPNSYLLPFGLNDDVFKQMLYEALHDYLRPFVGKIKRMWMVAGSGVLFSVMYKILTQTHFCLVQVGKKVELDLYDGARYTLYVSSLRLYEPIKTPVPYATTKSYDGKIWEFESKFANGDYIWNVAGIHQKI